VVSGISKCYKYYRHAVAFCSEFSCAAAMIFVVCGVVVQCEVQRTVILTFALNQKFAIISVYSLWNDFLIMIFLI